MLNLGKLKKKKGAGNRSLVCGFVFFFWGGVSEVFFGFGVS